MPLKLQFSPVDSTNVQRVQAIFFENRVYLRCFFADNSDAKACIFRFTPIGGNETEEFVVPRVSGSLAGSTCNRTKNYRMAYNNVTVSDLDANGMEGSLDLEVFPIRVTDTEEEYVALTNCEGKCIIIQSTVFFL